MHGAANLSKNRPTAQDETSRNETVKASPCTVHSGNTKSNGRRNCARAAISVWLLSHLIICLNGCVDQWCEFADREEVGHNVDEQHTAHDSMRMILVVSTPARRIVLRKASSTVLISSAWRRS